MSRIFLVNLIARVDTLTKDGICGKQLAALVPMLRALPRKTENERIR